MCFNGKILLLLATLTISTPAFSTIIELPTSYNRTSPWDDLIELGVANYTETDCIRTCVADEAPRVCLYTFVLEMYAAMGTACGDCADGVMADCFQPQCIPTDSFQREVMSVNRQFPGPPINVCKNDLIVVNVENQMAGTASTLHWHGMLQKNSPWMDGVPYVTQCPIGGTTFRYAFPVEESGTFMWHSHTGLHRPNGQYGALVAREPRSEEPWSEDLYDHDLPEHTIVLSDWMHDTSEMYFPGLPSRKPGTAPTTILINGLGWYLYGDGSDDSINASLPVSTFHVQENSRYRFRVINANSQVCSYVFQIQDHNMTLIATDGQPIEPVVVDALVTYAGERYDFVIETKNASSEGSAFWIHVRGLGLCATNYMDQYAVLSYNTNVTELGIIPTATRPTIADPLTMSVVFNYPNTTCGESSEYLCVTDLRTIEDATTTDNSSIWTAEPDVRMFLPFGFHYFDAETFHLQGDYKGYQNNKGSSIRAGTMNNLSFAFPSEPLIFFDSPSDVDYCNVDNLPTDCQTSDNTTASSSYCACTDVVVLKEGDIVQLILIDQSGETDDSHPFHLHGFDFYVLYTSNSSSNEYGYTVAEVTELVASNLTSSWSDTNIPPTKDTINVPTAGFAIIQFKANNPGKWFFHCHYEWHAATGMGMAFWVEGDMPPKPPGFPTCGNFDPLS
ncbi:oxidoreductase ptaE-like [Neodiprion fabricii]|uniref:oxidoreductase ptaE-like n=1 Tax=Neodiprion fabricii TaxID=2872261 RepID=UPI001ED9365A|nr:oxidoreductase ptaE-like [Neodiprion fabricii]